MTNLQAVADLRILDPCDELQALTSVFLYLRGHFKPSLLVLRPGL